MKMKWKRCIEMMEMMETEHVNEGIEWKQDGNMMETWKQSV